MRIAALLLALLVAGGCATAGRAVAAPAGAKPAAISPEDALFFETRVRPLLAEHCFGCHGPQKQMAGLRLDARASLLKGSDRGPAVLAGEPEKSALIQAIRYDGRVKMPPTGKLAPEAIAALTAWVKLSAPWPEDAAAAAPSAGVGKELKKTHWSFQPVRRPALPAVQNRAWVQTPIDAFILARLEGKGWKPSPPADRRTLIRRATFDLTGLPPTAAEVDAFVADRAPDAFAKVVDRLLASPRYGERWGRYWLDVARYADTRGYITSNIANPARQYPFAYTYRDYVIRAFNADLPYDQFLVEQIAADRLPPAEDKQTLAALGFLTLGRRFLNNQNDIIDDRIDVVTRGTMALTVSCARCHDHKFDPIPTADYYSLFGVFAASIEPTKLPMIGPPERQAAYQAHEQALKAAEEAVQAFRQAKLTELRERLRGQVGDYLLAAHESRLLPDDDRLSAFARSRGLSTTVIQRWQAYLGKRRAEHDPIFAAWEACAALPEQEFAAAASALAVRLAANADPQHRLNPFVAQAFAGAPPHSLKEVAERYAALLASVDKEWQEARHPAPRGTDPSSPGAAETAPSALPDADREALRQVLYGEQGPCSVGSYETERSLSGADRARFQSLQQQVDQIKASPDAPPFAMVLEDASTLRPARVLIRGNRNNPGPEVPRQFLAVLSGEQREPFKDGSGRLEMARAIADKSNPLTARVMVNRVWLHHFGAGLVRTPGDFGTRGEPPTHPELLDWLAAEFMATTDERPRVKGQGSMADEDGLPHRPLTLDPQPLPARRPSDPYACAWRLKSLHRLIMLSSTYQQRSDADPRYQRLDPENRLLGRMNRQRLDLEAMRDALLAVSGRLEPRMGGPAVELTTAPYAACRTVYGFIDRQNLPGFYRTFDLASPDATSPQRYTTTVPQQALFMMNSPFVVEQARSLAQRAAGAGSLPHRIQQLYRLAYGRWATPDELKIGLRFLRSPEMQGVERPSQELSPWQAGYGEYDEAAHAVRHFQPLAFWTGARWQGGQEYPDPELGHLRLTATGGHPGQDAGHAAIRRWVAPWDGTVSLSGTLAHPAPEGDGVQAYVVSSRGGELARWTVHGSQVMTAVPRAVVKKGDTLDFVVACGADNIGDAFTWAPEVRINGPAAGHRGGAVAWSAEADFRGPSPAPVPPLTAWEQYAQALLISNEFLFVD